MADLKGGAERGSLNFTKQEENGRFKAGDSTKWRGPIKVVLTKEKKRKEKKRKEKKRKEKKSKHR